MCSGENSRTDETHNISYHICKLLPNTKPVYRIIFKKARYYFSDFPTAKMLPLCQDMVICGVYGNFPAAENQFPGLAVDMLSF